MREFGFRSPKQVASTVSNPETLPHAKKKGLLQRYQQVGEHHPVLTKVAKTVGETVTLYVANEAAKKIVERYGRGLRIGHGRESTQGRIFKRYPVAATAITTGPIPVFEELFHRKFVSDYVDHKGHKGEMRWDVGIIQAAVFAASPQHLGKEAIPMPQFTFGLNAWRIQRQRGYPYAVLSHATYNALAVMKHIRKAKNK